MLTPRGCRDVVSRHGMIGSTRNVHVYAYAEPCDLRLGYDGLFAKARDKIGRDPTTGHMFLFVSRNRKRAKVLRGTARALRSI